MRLTANDISIQLDDRIGVRRARRQARGAARPARSAPRKRLLPPGWKKALPLAAAGVPAFAALLFMLWLAATPSGARARERATNALLGLSAGAGFKVQEIYLEGRVRTPKDQILAALGILRGDPILGIDLAATRRRLEGISWVKTATIERHLPGVVRLIITERAPIVIWQNQGHYYLVDRDSQLVGDEVEFYPDLPLMVGAGAPDHAAELVDLLKSEPDLAKRVKAAQWIGERRWNITLDSLSGPIDVRLPEDDPASSWHELARIEKEQSLLERKVTLIDMRVPDRLIVRSTGGAEESAPPKGRKKTQPGKEA